MDKTDKHIRKPDKSVTLSLPVVVRNFCYYCGMTFGRLDHLPDRSSPAWAQRLGGGAALACA
eukprot:2216286-Amphidinium_carterae.1